MDYTSRWKWTSSQQPSTLAQDPPTHPALRTITLLGICGLDNISQAMVVVGQLMPLGIQHSRLACSELASCTFKLLNFRWGLQLLPEEVQVISPSSKQGRRLLHLHQGALSWLLHPLLHHHQLGHEKH